MLIREIECPDVRIAVVEQVLHEVAMLGHDEHVAGRRQAVDDDHDVVARLAEKPQQAQPELVAGRAVALLISSRTPSVV